MKCSKYSSSKASKSCLGLLAALSLGLFSTVAIAQTEGGEGSPPPVPPSLQHDISTPSDYGPQHDNSNPSDLGPSSPDRGSGDRNLQSTIDSGNPAEIITQVEVSQSTEYANHFGFNLYGENASAETIANTLQQLASKTGVKAALIYVVETPKGLGLTLVLPSGSVQTSSSQVIPQNLKLAANPFAANQFAASPFAANPSATNLLRTNPFNLVALIASLRPNLQLAQQTSPPTGNSNLAYRLIPDATPSAVKRVVRNFRRELSDPTKVARNNYQAPAKTLYDWIIAPLKPALEANNIETIVFSLDRGFRSVPVAALFDGQKFLVEQYNLALIPSFSLTDTRYQRLQESKMLGMGISQATGGQTPLPSVAVEVPTLTSKIWGGTGYLDQQSTIAQFQALTQQERFGIIHLATHALFNPGKVEQSYIQFWNERLTLPQLREISLNQKWTSAPNIELLVLSACQSALGNDQAELGFTGLAVQSGVKTAVGSLWSVSDEGTLGLMSEFYRGLKTAPVRAAALRQAQLGLLQGQVKVVDGQLQLKDGTLVPLPAAAAQQKNVSFTHPYYWSAFTMIGNWN
ncbi:MAG: CHAT domain-containing protein [Thermosynechococcaceae cyanobacterium MS004]|nr:CHAT domain-containing protein [Thermosynechococcaceae cyanobacterium MS004]